MLLGENMEERQLSQAVHFSQTNAKVHALKTAAECLRMAEPKGVPRAPGVLPLGPGVALSCRAACNDGGGMDGVLCIQHLFCCTQVDLGRPALSAAWGSRQQVAAAVSGAALAGCSALANGS